MKIFVECPSSTQNAVLYNKKYYTSAGTVSYDNSDIYFDVDQKVPNIIRGYLIYNGQEWDFVLPQTYKLLKTSPKKTTKIALILESPHKHEYDKSGNTYFPIEPAMGTTGLKIRGGITKRSFITQLCTDNDYEVKLFNAVQYQCSCYNYISGLNTIDKELRDAVFRLLFKMLQQDLINDLQKYVPDIVVNCCTGSLLYCRKTKQKENGKDVFQQCQEEDFDILNGLCTPKSNELNMLVDEALREFTESSCEIYTTGEKEKRKRKRTITSSNLSKKIVAAYYCDAHPSSWK